MDPERWERVQELFFQALERPEEERRDFVEEGCAGDAELLASVTALLEADSRGAPLLDGDLAAAAAGVLEDDGLDAPRWIGPYRVLRPLGEGGMGVVYLAERPDLDHRVAIKLLRDAALSPARRRRFTRETRTLARLDHPSIARLYDADVLPDGTPWFAMEWVEGLPVTEHLRTRSAGIRERLELFQEVCRAVQHAHQKAVIHRDLKPSNILVTAEGRVKLLDFGIARHLEGADASTDPTRTGLRMMTPAYAAPEQITGEGFGVYTDVYALGVLLYEILAGRLPFDLSDRTPREAERILLEAEVPRPSVAARPHGEALARPVEWADLDVLCLTAMHRDVERRYASVEALMRDVDHFLRGEPLDARPDSLVYRGRKFLGRNRAGVTGAAAVLAAGVTLVSFYTVRLAAARDAALAEAARAERVQSFMTSLFQGGDPVAGPADTLRVVTLLERGAREASALESEPEVRAALLETLGRLFHGLGELERADSILGTSLAERRRLHGADHPETASVLVSLAALKSDRGALEEAQQLAEEGATLMVRHRTRGHPEALRALTTVAHVLQSRGDYSGSVAVLEEALAAFQGQSTAPERLAALEELAGSHYYAANYPMADSTNRTLLTLNRSLNGSGHPSVAGNLINLAAIRHQQGRFLESEEFYREALEIMEGWHGPRHLQPAAVRSGLARALYGQQRYDEAADQVRLSLEVHEEVFGPVHPRVATLLNTLGSVEMDRGELDRAMELYRRAEAIYREVYGEDHSFVAVALGNQGNVHFRRQDFTAAEGPMREAEAIFLRTLGPDHLETAIARIRLGRVQARRGRWEEAEASTRAGYDVLSGMEPGPLGWLQTARTDLAQIYRELGRIEESERMSRELEAAARRND